MRSAEQAVLWEPPPPQTYAVISLLNVGASIDDVWNPRGISRLLIHCSDRDPVIAGDIDETTFNENDAERIARFILEQRDRVDILLVHCHAGWGRSAGVALAIWDVLGLRHSDIRDVGPNRHFFDLTRQALARALSVREDPA